MKKNTSSPKTSERKSSSGRFSEQIKSPKHSRGAIRGGAGSFRTKVPNPIPPPELVKKK